MCLDGRAVEIDCQIAPIISWLWSMGIETLNCCQGGGDVLAYIMFPPGDHAARFGRKVLAVGFHHGEHLVADAKVWGRCANVFIKEHFGVDRPEDWKWYWSCTYREKYGNFTITCRFPNGDIAELAQRIAACSG